MPGVNRQIRLAAAPVGMPKESDFQLTESPVPHPAGGEVLVRELYLSVDPSIRGRAFGFHRSADNAGGILGPLIAFAVLTWWHSDLRTVFWYAAIPGAIKRPAYGRAATCRPEAPPRYAQTPSWR